MLREAVSSVAVTRPARRWRPRPQLSAGAQAASSLGTVHQQGWVSSPGLPGSGRALWSARQGHLTAVPLCPLPDDWRRALSGEAGGSVSDILTVSFLRRHRVRGVRFMDRNDRETGKEES